MHTYGKNLVLHFSLLRKLVHVNGCCLILLREKHVSVLHLPKIENMYKLKSWRRTHPCFRSRQQFSPRSSRKTCGSSPLAPPPRACSRKEKNNNASDLFRHYLSLERSFQIWFSAWFLGEPRVRSCTFP
jgi:hypothetical protein